MTDVKVEEVGKYVVIKFRVKDEHLEALDEMSEHHTPRRLTEGEKVKVVYELLRSNIEDILADWTWYLADVTSLAISTANDVIEEADSV